MMHTTRHASSVQVNLLSLLLTYSLLISLLSPFTVRRADAAAARAGKAAASPASTLAKKARYRDGELIIRFHQGISEQDKNTLVANKGARREKKLQGKSRLEKLSLAAGRDPRAIAAELRQNPMIELAEPNYLVERDEIVPNDPRFGDQWALRNSGQNNGQATADINAAQAWETTTGSPSTVIAVIDSGIDFNHPDLQHNQWTNTSEQANDVDDDHNGLVDDLHGWDWVANNKEITDEQGHGTLMAGLIAAEGNNSKGTTGVMWRASLMSLRVLDRTGTGDVVRAVEAIDYAVAMGATVINCSWGTDGESVILREAIERAAARQVLIVCSAGNSGRDIDGVPYYPASFALPNMIAVAATNNLDHLASSSNWGATRATVAAPGSEVLTTQMGGSYRAVSGTSAATAIVSGVVGLIRTVRPLLGAADTKASLINGSRQVADLAGKVSSGGVVSAAGALTTMQGPDVDPSATPTPTPTPDVTPTPSPTPADGEGGDDGASAEIGTPEPPGTPGPPRAGLPNLDSARSLEPVDPVVPEPIHADAMCLTCEAGGSEPPPGTTSPSNPDPDFSKARTLPPNKRGQQGVDLGSRNFNWSMPLFGLSGRAGMDLGLTLVYNSLVWVKDGNTMRFNADRGFPGPGFRLGLPVIQQKYHNPLIGTGGVDAYLIVTPSGGAVELRQVASNVYESADNSFIQMIDNGASGAVVNMPDGTELTFVPSVNNELRCTRIMDRNGNYISAVYQASTGRLTSITDTLGRVITFAYDPKGYMGQIRQQRTNDSGVVQTFVWAKITYDALTVQPNFGTLAVQGPQSSTMNVPVQLGLADGSYYKFEYTSFGQIWKISHFAPDNGLLSYTSYNLAGSPLNPSSAQTDCPRFTEQRTWARDWNGDTNGVAVAAEEAVTKYSVSGNDTWTKVEMPDGTSYKETFASTGWQKGLTTKSEVFEEGATTPAKWTTITYTQDDETLTYKKNPRVDDTSVYDNSQNRRRTSYAYHPVEMFNLVKDVKEYAAGGSAVLRTTHFEYNLADKYKTNRILGLVSEQTVYKGLIGSATATLESKVTFEYDEGSGLIVFQSKPVQHDAAYDTTNTTTRPRGNLTSVIRWDATDLATAADPNKAVETNTAYNTSGSVIFTRDALLHKTTISYEDSFYNDTTFRNTWAFPTSVTDPDLYVSKAEYDYDTGEVRKTRAPSSGTATAYTYLDQFMEYDSAGRITRVTNLNNGAYARWVYPTSHLLVQQYRLIESGLGQAYSWQVMDGAGHVIGTASDLPGSTGLFSGRSMVYDVMGRMIKQSNPAEMDANWVAKGDDASGWRWTQQQYDWKGRPTVTTNQDTTSMRTISYDGCGCAGGEVTTFRDEKGRERRLTKDILGRLSKVEEVNWEAALATTVTYTTTYTYDVLDNLTMINQGGRQRKFIYDGHGRLASRTTPEQGETKYTYNADDTVSMVTDARGVTSTFSYSKRHEMKAINYSVPVDPNIAETPDLTFTYDAAGHRLSMTEAQFGSTVYDYNNLGQLESETRSFTDTAWSAKLSYEYNLAGELTKMTNTRGPDVGYVYDKIGRAVKVTANDLYAGVSDYVEAIDYRAFGGIKAMTYGNTKALSISYDTRMNVKQWNVSGVMGWNYYYNYFNENTGRVTYAQSLNDAKLHRSYEYDLLGRLRHSFTGTSARGHVGLTDTWVGDGPYGGDLYEYDQWGNMTERREWIRDDPSNWDAVHSLSYVATLNAKNQLTKNPSTGLTMTYDLAGNLKNDGTQVYTYDATGQQTEAKIGGVATLQQWYDGDRLRLKKVEAGETTYYVRSSVMGGRVVAELEANGVMKRGYVYAGGQMLAIQDKTDSNVQQVTWVHQDPITKSQRFTSSAGALLSQRIDLDPWGVETARTVDPTSPQQKPAHRFTTYERDKNGTDEAMHRRYNSVRTRFEQPDPWDSSYNLANPQSFNRYSYVQNDPVNFVDPTGLFSTAVCLPQFGSCGGGGGNGGSGYSGHPMDSLTYDFGGGGPTSLNIAIGLAQYHLRLYRTLGYDISNRSREEGRTGSLLFFLNHGTPQDTSQIIPLGDLWGNINKILSNRRCSDFISELIDVARMLSRIKPYSYDAKGIVNEISRQGMQGEGGYVFTDVYGPGAGGGQALGTINGGDATALIGPKALVSGTLSASIISATQISYALSAIHESIHLAGASQRYNDETLARAAQIVTGAPGFPTGLTPGDINNVTSYGGYWNNQLIEHCSPK